MEAIRVGALLDDKNFDLRLTLVAGRQGLSRRVSSSRIQKPGLALAGFTEHLHHERVQVFGNTEMSYLGDAARASARCEVLRSFFAADLACLVVTKGLDVPAEMIAAAEEAGVPLLRTTPPLLDVHRAACRTTSRTRSPRRPRMHGVLIDVFGVGVLLLGKSGIGKSEIALDLVMRGHRLVADDIVDVKRRTPDAVLRGRLRDHQAPHGDPRPRHHQHQGPLRRRRGPRARRRSSSSSSCVEWDPDDEYDRLGVEEQQVPHPRRGDPDARSSRSARAAT